jgi:TPR repeat protein
MDLIDRSKPPIVYLGSKVNFFRFASGSTMHHYLSITIIACLLLGWHAPMEAAESSKAAIFWADLWKEAASAEVKALLRDAQVGKPDAQIKLGHAYRDGDGVDRNIEKAIELYTLASKEPEALYALGLLYCNGNGVVQDFPKSKTFLEKSSGLGFADASDTLALLARDGIGEIQDPKLSHQWTLKAAAQGKPSAMLRCARQYEKGEGVERDIRKAFRWCLRAAESGLPEAQHLAGFSYYIGKGVDPDPAASFAWLHLAAEKKASGAAEARDMVGSTLTQSQVTRAWDLMQAFRKQALPVEESEDSVSEPSPSEP